eukprot:374460-Pyramimonas_sp.AAC.1
MERASAHNSRNGSLTVCIAARGQDMADEMRAFFDGGRQCSDLHPCSRALRASACILALSVAASFFLNAAPPSSCFGMHMIAIPLPRGSRNCVHCQHVTC